MGVIFEVCESCQDSTNTQIQIEKITQLNSMLKVSRRNQLTKSQQISLKMLQGDGWIYSQVQGQDILYKPQKVVMRGKIIKESQGDVKIQFIQKGLQYDGGIKNGKAHGSGLLEDKLQKYKFVGEWKQSRPFKGVLVLNQDKNIENIYIIDFQKRLVQINYLDKRVYKGEVNTSNLLPHGKGKVIFPESQKKRYYQGYWKNGYYQGQGILQWRDGSKYQGEFINGKKQGFGIYTFSNGNFYEGYWANGKQQGQGIIYRKNRQVIKKGIWMQGQYVNLNSQKNEKSLKSAKINMQESLVQNTQNKQNLNQNQQITAWTWIDHQCYHYKNITFDRLNLKNISVMNQSYIFGKRIIKKRYQLTIHNKKSAVKGIGIIDSSYKSLKNYDKITNCVWYENLGFCQVANKVHQCSMLGYQQGDSIKMIVDVEKSLVIFQKKQQQEEIRFPLLQDNKIRWVPLLIMCCYQTAVIKKSIYDQK